MSPPVSTRDLRLILNALPEVGPVTLARLQTFFEGDEQAILNAPVSVLRQVPGIGPKTADTIANWSTHVDLAAEKERLQTWGGRFIISEDEDYPELLKNLYDAPIGLYVCGSASLRGPAVAIVGTRQATHYGKAVARRFARDLAQAGVLVVSGMARGIDTEAHLGALEAGGRTAAVFGNGPDIIYPPENRALCQRLREEGCILSEFPFGRKGDRQTFPQRNRIVSGMAEAIVVVETADKGGSLITARFAAEHGRQVYAVPGRLDAPQSCGCHLLIRDGATLVTSASEILEDLKQPQFSFSASLAGLEAGERLRSEADGLASMPENHQRILACFPEGEALHPDQITSRLELPHATIASSLMMLELRGILLKNPDGRYEKRPRI